MEKRQFEVATKLIHCNDSEIQRCTTVKQTYSLCPTENMTHSIEPHTTVDINLINILYLYRPTV